MAINITLLEVNSCNVSMQKLLATVSPVEDIHESIQCRETRVWTLFRASYDEASTIPENRRLGFVIVYSSMPLFFCSFDSTKLGSILPF